MKFPWATSTSSEAKYTRGNTTAATPASVARSESPMVGCLAGWPGPPISSRRGAPADSWVSVIGTLPCRVTHDLSYVPGPHPAHPGRERTGTYGPFRASFVPRPGQAFRALPAPTETSIGMWIPHGRSSAPFVGTAAVRESP